MKSTRPEGMKATCASGICALVDFFGADVDGSWIAELLELDDAVGREDTALVERVQTGVASGALESGRLLGHAEQLVAHFQPKLCGVHGVPRLQTLHRDHSRSGRQHLHLGP